MIHVEKLTKRYAGKTAIDEVSFDVSKGEIVGFLGPNGAGKSTTLKILTCYLSATSGSASIAGHDIFSDSLRARQHIGYMPENVPLYTDMRVSEYLDFRARLKGVPGRDVKRHVEEAVETTALGEVRRKMISSLSKGYRQRVGLADALVNKPDLLILDEPTNGLDPNQIRQVRDLIRTLGERHTILISTHILSEVEMICGRVIIINRGHVMASDTPQNLIRRLGAAGKTVLEVRAAPREVLEELEKLPGVDRAQQANVRGEWTTVEITTEPNIDLREDLHQLAVAKQWPVRELTRRTASLEDAFVGLTNAKTATASAKAA